MWRIIGRIFLIPVGLLFGMSVSLSVLYTLGLERLTQAVGGPIIDFQNPDSLFYVFDQFNDALVLVSGLTIVPALVGVLVGEIGRIKSVLYYICAGGAALVAIPLLSIPAGSSGLAFSFWDVWPVFATAGFAGGFVYWLFAGRTA